MTSDTPTTSPRNPTLEDAWDRYSRYDFNASKAQKRFFQQRKLILILGVAATTLAIIYTVLETRTANGIPWLPESINTFLSDQFLPALHVLVVLVPILSTALIAYSLRFNMGVNWISLRGSAEALKKEIYLYRMRVGEYSPTMLGSESRDVHLARRAKIINKRLMETQVNQTGLEAYKGKLPPQYSTAEGDDGFSDMTAEQYLLWRIEDQFNYYQRKSVKFTRELQRFQLMIILLGGVGTALAAFNLEIWVAISGALATAFATFLEFKGVETTIVACNTAAADLYDVRTWWRALSDDAKQLSNNVETLVHSAEAIVQSENAGWVQEMRDALAEIYSGDKEEVSKKEAFAPVLGKDYVPEHAISSEATQSDGFQDGSEMAFSTTADAPSDTMSTDMPVDGTTDASITDIPAGEVPADFTSDGSVAGDEMPADPLMADMSVPPADPDPFGEPPAEPVVHEEFMADTPVDPYMDASVDSSDSSMESTTDAPIDAATDDPSVYGSLGVAVDSPEDTLVDGSFDTSADSSVVSPVEMPLDAPIELALEEPIATVPLAEETTPSAEPTSTDASADEQPSDNPQEDEPSMTTVI
ncbi:DUF4231 domain-containing protein [Oscillatoria sp. FACHB-1407]|uniref:DUF4231 domain-containing protein n=1 Tax=Oscillatoria sp. FACHB-1407 TaxID=2692847 RepID=UPI0016888948|nr:DUF4231 domain-containing protein [Oscillatoria sp. FACHB-1407]MBD2462845.1 DUF4231 domain-containing protein [Oscillatoria sp. FACHB-1407]